MNKLCDIFINDKNLFNEVATLVDKPTYLEEQRKIRNIFGFPISQQQYMAWKRRYSFIKLTPKQDAEFTEWFCQLRIPSISKHINNYDNLQWIKKQEKIFSPPVALEKAAIHICSSFGKGWWMYKPVERAIATNVVEDQSEALPILTLYAPNVHSGNIAEIKRLYGDLFRIPNNISFALFFSDNMTDEQITAKIKKELPELKEQYRNTIAKNQRWSSITRKSKLENTRNLYIEYLLIKEKNPEFSKEKCYEQIVIEDELRKGRDPYKLGKEGNNAIHNRKEQVKKSIETYVKLLK